MKTSFALVLLLSLLLIAASIIQAAPGNNSSFCAPKCKVRCSKSGRPKLCLKYCGICCGKCNCVPSGTFGNKYECPCYDNILNSKGKPKCP